MTKDQIWAKLVHKALVDFEYKRVATLTIVKLRKDAYSKSLGFLVAHNTHSMIQDEMKQIDREAELFDKP